MQAETWNVSMPSDVFPPGHVGGAAWSAATLARALVGCGHRVVAVVPTPQPNTSAKRGVLVESPGPVPTLRVPYRVLPFPFVKNYSRHERLWPRLAEVLAHLHEGKTHLLHAQHVQVAPAAVLAGQRLNVPVVVTVRDHWPWDYFATGLHGGRTPYETRAGMRGLLAGMVTDLPGRLGPLRGVLALPALPYMLAHMQRRRAFLAQARAVVAVSRYMAERLRRVVPAERVHVIPNMVDVAAIEAITATPPQTDLSEPFLLYVGKLEHNKGARLLVEVFRVLRSQEGVSPDDPSFPLLVIVGSGALQPEIERDLAALRVRVRFLSWVSHDEVLRLVARCQVLLFPSAWGEPLSRVLLEASVMGVPIVAMPTGGTPDILTHGVNGLLATTPEQFARHLSTLLQSVEMRGVLAHHARRLARERFSVEAVLPRVEGLYRSLIGRV